MLHDNVFHKQPCIVQSYKRGQRYDTKSTPPSNIRPHKSAQYPKIPNPTPFPAQSKESLWPTNPILGFETGTWTKKGTHWEALVPLAPM